jgi:hypothetical protein
MFQVKGRTGIRIHARPSRYLFGILKMRSLYIIRGPHLGEVHHAGADSYRDALRLRIQLREHVTRIVVQPRGLLALSLGLRS